MKGSIVLTKEELSVAISGYLGRHIVVTEMYFWDGKDAVDITFIEFTPPALGPPKAYTPNPDSSKPDVFSDDIPF